MNDLVAVKGKNFSANNLGQRKKNDDYSTPTSMAQQLLHAETGFFLRDAKTLEPAAGEGALVGVLKSEGFKRLTSYDLYRGDSPRDFLTEARHFDQIITNPPYKLAQEFILHAKKVSDRFAYLLPLSYLHGVERYRTIYQDKVFPLRRLRVFTRYPMLGDLIRSDGKYRTGMVVYAWFIWEKASHTVPAIPPTVHWIDNQQYILTASEWKKG